MAAPRGERGRLAFDGQFWGLSNGWSGSLAGDQLRRRARRVRPAGVAAGGRREV